MTVLEKRGFRRGGLTTAILKALELENDEREEFSHGIVPDAFFVAPARRMVVAVEVEDQSPLTWRKLESYVRLWFALDSEEWDLELAVMTPHGVGHYVNLCAEYIRSLYERNRFDRPGRATPFLRRDVPPFYVERIRLPLACSSQVGYTEEEHGR